MRKIDLPSILVFLALTLPTSGMAVLVGSSIIDLFSPSDSILFLKTITSVPLIFLFNLIIYRLFLWVRPLPTGDYRERSPEQFTYNIYVLFYLIYFNLLIPTFRIPVPLMRLIYLALGARLGPNTYSAGVIHDPPLVQIGANTILGFDSVICPHAVEGPKVFFSPISIGNSVTVGMRAIVMAGCAIEDNAIIAANSLLAKGTHVRKGELWAGIPARRIEKTSGIPLGLASKKAH